MELGIRNVLEMITVPQNHGICCATEKAFACLDIDFARDLSGVHTDRIAMTDGNTLVFPFQFLKARSTWRFDLVSL